MVEYRTKPYKSCFPEIIITINKDSLTILDSFWGLEVNR